MMSDKWWQNIFLLVLKIAQVQDAPFRKNGRLKAIKGTKEHDNQRIRSTRDRVAMDASRRQSAKLWKMVFKTAFTINRSHTKFQRPECIRGFDSHVIKETIHTQVDFIHNSEAS